MAGYSALFGVIFRQVIMQNHIQQRLVNPYTAVVFYEAQLAKAFMKKLTRERVVPIISARAS